MYGKTKPLGPKGLTVDDSAGVTFPGLVTTPLHSHCFTHTHDRVHIQALSKWGGGGILLVGHYFNVEMKNGGNYQGLLYCTRKQHVHTRFYTEICTCVGACALVKQGEGGTRPRICVCLYAYPRDTRA